MTGIVDLNVEFPETIISEILLRLPVKPLYRFKCVSKSWNHMISEPSFEQNRNMLASETHNSDHLIVKHPSRSPAKMERYSDHELTDIHFNDLYRTDDFHLIGSCNGVVCFATSPTLLRKYGGFELILWNPTTNKTFRVPKNKYYYTSDQHRFCFNPRNADEFKIISIEDSSVHVYNFYENSWTNKGRTFRLGVSSSAAAEQAVVDGSPHWCSEDSYGVRVVVSFDPINEQWNKIPLPPVGQLRPSTANLGGCLAVIAEADNEDLEVWVMKEYGVVESWTKEFVVQRPVGCLGCHFKCVWRKRLVFLVEREGQEIEVAWYEPESKSFNTIFMADSVDTVVFSYVESVVSVESPTASTDPVCDSEWDDIPTGTDWYISGLTDNSAYY